MRKIEGLNLLSVGCICHACDGSLEKESIELATILANAAVRPRISRSDARVLWADHEMFCAYLRQRVL